MSVLPTLSTLFQLDPIKKWGAGKNVWPPHQNIIFFSQLSGI
jgi:hypothetical protein